MRIDRNGCQKRLRGDVSGSAIIHMNGRVYSPNLGRMLSPDPVTQAPENGQNYNRYTYAFNNPLKFTDPSGYNGVSCTIFDFICGAWSVGGSNPDGVGGMSDSLSGHLWTVFADFEANRGEGYKEQLARYDYWLATSIGDQIDTSGEAVTTRRVPGVIYITGHEVGGVGPIHLAIEFDDGSTVSWISAGPGFGLTEDLLGPLLVSGVGTPLNGVRESDVPNENYVLGVVIPPTGMTAEEYFQALVIADSNYCDCVEYDTLPADADGFNSNSFVAGLVSTTGGTASVDFEDFVGGADPLPDWWFW